MPNRLIFVYNADSGLFNTVADIGHKLFSPQTYPCRLCSLTHAPFAMRRQWKRFVEKLEPAPRYLHRDQLATHYPGLRVTPPAVLVAADDGAVSVCLDAATIESCRSLDDLQRLIAARCCAFPATPSGD